MPDYRIEFGIGETEIAVEGPTRDEALRLYRELTDDETGFPALRAGKRIDELNDE